MKLGQWLVGLVMGLAMGTAAAQAGFPTQDYIDEFNRAMRDEVQRQANTFDSDGLRIIASNLAVDRSAWSMSMAMGMMVSDTVTAEDRQRILNDLKVEHFDFACEFYAEYVANFYDLASLDLHFVVVNERKELLYDAQETSTEYDIW